MTDPSLKCWTIERRGPAFVLMGWATDLARGPLEIRAFDSEAGAKSAAERESGRTLAWRAAAGGELKHDVVAAADV